MQPSRWLRNVANAQKIAHVSQTIDRLLVALTWTEYLRDLQQTSSIATTTLLNIKHAEMQLKVT